MRKRRKATVVKKEGGIVCDRKGEGGTHRNAPTTTLES